MPKRALHTIGIHVICGLMSVAAATGVVAAAHGQVTGSIRSGTAPIDVPEGRVTGDAARAVSDNLAFCIVKLHYGPVRKALAPPRNLMNDYKYLPKLMDNDCFSGGGALRSGGGGSSMDMTTNPISFRGGLYKALVKKDYGRKPATFGTTALVMDGDDAQVMQFADCVVRADPESVRKLTLTVAGTTAENAAVDAIKPSFAKCAVADTQMRFSKGNLVGILAEAYYREAEAAKPASAK